MDISDVVAGTGVWGAGEASGATPYGYSAEQTAAILTSTAQSDAGVLITPGEVFTATDSGVTVRPIYVTGPVATPMGPAGYGTPVQNQVQTLPSAQPTPSTGPVGPYGAALAPQNGTVGANGSGGGPATIGDGIGGALATTGEGIGGALGATGSVLLGNGGGLASTSSPAPAVGGGALSGLFGGLGKAGGEVIDTFSWIKWAVMAVIVGLFAILLITALKNNTAAKANLSTGK